MTEPENAIRYIGLKIGALQTQLEKAEERKADADSPQKLRLAQRTIDRISGGIEALKQTKEELLLTVPPLPEN